MIAARAVPAALEFIVAQPATGLDPLWHWARKLALRSDGSSTPTPLAVERIEPVDRDSLPPRVRRAAHLSDLAGFQFARIHLRPSHNLAPRLPARMQMFDIVHGDRVIRPHAVAVHGALGSTLRLAFATDLHLARFWEQIAQTLDRHAPELAPNFDHPGQRFDRFVSSANRLADAGELDVVVLGGDLVDYVRVQPRSKSLAASRETNLTLVVEALSRLRVPAFVVPGNHDYRLYPWRIRRLGFRCLGLPEDRAVSLLRRAGLWDDWPLRSCDFDSLHTWQEDGETSLAQHLLQLAPGTDHAMDLGGLRLVFACTGRDMLPRWREVERGRRRLLLRSLFTSWHDPDTEGLTERQVTQIGTSLRGATGAALFHHAPLLSRAASARQCQRPIELDPGARCGRAPRAAFERRLFSTGWRRGVFFRNPGSLLRALASTTKPLVSFSGHVHRSGAFELDRDRLVARSVAFAPADPGTDARRMARLFTSPAIGQTAVEHTGRREQPSFALAEFREGRLVELHQRSIARTWPTPARGVGEATQWYSG